MHILAPLSVIPTHQRKGIGKMLILKGVEMLRKIDSQLVFVLGDKNYYSRFGFIKNALKQGFSTPCPETFQADHADYWMVQPLSSKKIEKTTIKKVICATSLNKPEYWE